MKRAGARLLQSATAGGEMEDQELRDQFTALIDDAIESYRGRDLVAASEVTDLLLDLRLMLLAADAPAPSAN
jgi:hypothetical protein